MKKNRGGGMLKKICVCKNRDRRRRVALSLRVNESASLARI